jgi:3-oxoacyl-(acyl-carrier-protein) synthase
MLCDLGATEANFVIASANGTFIDQAEQRALEHVIPNTITYTAKPALGESVGASGLWQIILGAQALRHEELPPVLHAEPATSLRLARSHLSVAGARHAIVLGCGVNQQVAGLRLAIRANGAERASN